MTDDRAPAPSEPTAPNTRAQEFPPKGRQSFASVRRDLSEKELKSPGVQKMLLDDVDRLEREVNELKGFRDRYYDKAEKCAVYEQKEQRVVAIEIIHIACLAIGSVAVAYAPTIWSHQPIASICLGCGVVLLAGSLLAKWKQR